MNESLHPLTLSEILDRTAQLYRSRFLIFLGIGTIPAATMFVFAAGTFAFITWMGSNARSGKNIADTLVWGFLVLLMLIAVPVSLGVGALGEAAMSDASARLFLGEKITIRNAYKAAWNRGWRYVGLFLLQGLVIVGGPAVVFALAIFGMVVGKVSGLAANDNSPMFGGLIFLLIVVLGVFAVWMLLRFCLAFPTCVVEQAPAWSSLKRGVVLSKGTRARIFVLYLMGVFLSQILSWCVIFPVLIGIALIPGLHGQAHAQAVGMFTILVTYGSYFVVKALIKPIYGIALTLFYFDQRIRKEGFDIEWMMQQAGMLAPAAAPQPEVEPLAPPVDAGMVAEPFAVATPTSLDPQDVPTPSSTLGPTTEESRA
jgi:MFS family permease